MTPGPVAGHASAAEMGVEVDQHIRVGGRRLGVRRSGSGPPVVLLNGVLMSLATWEPVVRHLDGFDCIRVAAPGVMDTAGSQPVVTMSGFASLIRDLMDELGVDRADVIGYSFGGMVAQQLAFDAPTRVRRMVLASTSCGLGAIPSNPMSWWNALLDDGWPSPTEAVPVWFMRQWASVLRQEFGTRWGDGLWLFAEQIAAASTWSSLLWLQALVQPTLVITGTLDALVPAQNTHLLASRMPDARTYRVVGGGHQCLWDYAEETGPVIAEFLRSSETAALDQPFQLG